jgi:glucan phosphorylase
MCKFKSWYVEKRRKNPKGFSADTYTKNDVLSIQQSIVSHVEYTLARSRFKFDNIEAYLATAHSLRDRLIEGWNDTQTYFREQNPKRVYYLSMEFLMGRSLLNALYNLEVKGPYVEALHELGYDLETLMEQVSAVHLCVYGLNVYLLVLKSTQIPVCVMQIFLDMPAVVHV